MKRVQKENGVETLYNCWDEKELLVSIKTSAGNAALDLGHVLSLFLTDAYPWLEGRTQRKFLEIPPYLGDPQEVSVNRTLRLHLPLQLVHNSTQTTSSCYLLKYYVF